MSVFDKPFTTKHGTAPFSQIKIADYKPAFDRAIAHAKADIDRITANPLPPTFENTIEALAFSGMELDTLSSIFFNLNSAETNDEMQKIA